MMEEGKDGRMGIRPRAGWRTKLFAGKRQDRPADKFSEVVSPFFHSSILPSLLVLFLLLFCFAAPCSASFIVSFNDGTTRIVSKVVFHGEQAEIYPVKGMPLTIQTRSIDFKSSGFARPTFPDGVCTDGRTVQKIEMPTAERKKVTQDELKAQWESSGMQIAVATADQGSVQKGQTVKVVSKNEGSVTIVFVDSQTGIYKRTTLSAENFEESFEIKEQPKKVTAAPPPVALPSLPTLNKPAHKRIISQMEPVSEAKGKPTLWIPFLISFVLLGVGVVTTRVLTIRDAMRAKKKSKRRRL